MNWNFPIETSPGGTEGTNSGTSTAFEDAPITYLAREAIQNSLDAHDPEIEGPVKMEIAFECLPLKDLPNFLVLRSHFEGILCHPGSQEEKFKMSLINGLPKDDAKVIPVVRISDWNTLGMDYKRDPKVEKTPALNAFISRGVNTKNENQTNGGSRGWGKGVFFALSPIRTILVSTYSKIDNKKYFIGKSIFCHHFIGDQQYRHFGMYGDDNQQPSTHIPKSIARHRESKGFGSDIYIMGWKVKSQDDQFKYRVELIKCIIQNYWCAIIKGELEITIKGNKDIFDCHINKDTLFDLINSKNIKYKEHKEYEFGFKDLDVVKNDLKSLQPKPYFEAYVKAENGIKEDGQKSFYLFEEELPILGQCKFYMVKNPDIGSSKIVYMRKTHMIIYCDHNRIMSSGFYGLFICEDIKGDKLLRNMEGPVHDKWSASIARNRLTSDEEESEALAKQVLDEIASFIESCIKNVFDFSKIDEMAIPGLEMGFEVNNDGISGNKEEDSALGNGRWAIISIKDKTKSPKPTDTDQAPSVLLDTTVIKDDDGNERGGRDHGGRGHRPNNPGPGDNNTYSQSPEGKSGKVIHPLKAEIRTYPKKIENKNYNVVILKSLENVGKVTFSINVVTEKGSMKMDIQECKFNGSKIQSENNTFTINHLQQNNIYEIELFFEDNMIHTIKVGTEVKKD